MNIMLLMDLYRPITFYMGGLETHVQVLTKELRERGHKVTICTTGGLRKDEVSDSVSIYSFEGLFQKIPFLFKDSREKWPPPTGDWLLTKKLKKIIEKEKPDIIHSHGWILYSVLPLIRKYTVPLIVTLHSYGLICPKRSGEICEQRLTNRCISCGKELYGTFKSLMVYYALKMNRPKLKQVDRFIAISSFQKSIFCKYLGLNDNDIVVIPNAVDLKKFSPSTCIKQSERVYERQLGVKSGSNKIVYVSRFSLDKLNAILNVINATPKIIKEFSNTQILLVGGGESFDYANKVAEKINHQLGRKTIIMTGAIKDGGVPKVMRLADVVIGVGRVSLEAMACGKPVIIAGSTPGPFGGNYGGIVTPSNIAELKVHNFSGRNSFERTTPHKIAEACVRLLTDKEYRLFLGRFGREYVEKEHDARKIVRQVEAVYRDAIKG